MVPPIGSKLHSCYERITEGPKFPSENIFGSRTLIQSSPVIFRFIGVLQITKDHASRYGLYRPDMISALRLMVSALQAMISARANGSIVLVNGPTTTKFRHDNLLTSQNNFPTSLEKFTPSSNNTTTFSYHRGTGE